MVFGMFALIGLLSLVASIIYRNRNKAAILGSIAFLLLTVIIPIGIYTANIGTIAELEAFYLASATNFEYARDDTASYLSEETIAANTALIPITGSIEKIGVGQSVAERIREYRNSVNSYNSAFARYKAYKNNLLYGIAYPEIPDYMRLLIINPVEK